MPPTQNVARHHHYVPQFLLSRWATKNAKNHVGVTGYYWDERAQALKPYHRGTKYFCQRPDLFSLPSHPTATDVMETQFFKTIDDSASLAIAKLTLHRDLEISELEQLVAFMLSLEARRPAVVSALKSEGPKHFLAEAAKDPRLTDFMKEAGKSLEQIYRDLEGHTLEERFLLTVQKLTTSPVTMADYLRAKWGVLKTPLGHDTFFLGDRPLVRIGASHAPDALWLLPIAPRLLLIGSPRQSRFEQLRVTAPDKLVEAVNRATVGQCDQYVFAVPGLGRNWLPSAMQQRAQTGYADHTNERMLAGMQRMLELRSASAS